MPDDPRSEPHTDPDEPMEEVVRETVGGSADPTTRREAVELELDAHDRSDEGEDVAVTEIVEGPTS